MPEPPPNATALKPAVPAEHETVLPEGQGVVVDPTHTVKEGEDHMLSLRSSCEARIPPSSIPTIVDEEPVVPTGEFHTEAAAILFSPQRLPSVQQGSFGGVGSTLLGPLLHGLDADWRM